jgi:hypothetical protein
MGTKQSVIKLRDATQIGQRVAGSSQGSVYTTVLVSNLLNVAVRVEGATVSIRVEPTGAEFSEPAAHICDALQFKRVTTHASQHFPVLDVDTAYQFVSSVLAAIFVRLVQRDGCRATLEDPVHLVRAISPSLWAVVAEAQGISVEEEA